MEYELDVFNVWVFYLKSRPSEVYAYTTVKSIKNRFMELRNMDVFHVEKISMDEFEFSAFAYANRYNKLDEVYMALTTDSDGIGVHVATTMVEQDLCTQKYNQIENEMEDVFRGLLHNDEFKLKKKYAKAVKYLLNTTYTLKYPGGEQHTSRISEFSIFMHVFKHTLKDPKSIK